MTFRRLFLLLASIATSVILIELLIRVGKINLRIVVWQLQSVSHVAFLKLVLLNGVLVYLSTQKWRSIDAVLRGSSDTVPTWVTSFAVTSGGMALGLILPTQIGMTTARTLGTYVHGRPLKRGTAATLFEQSFDLFIVLVLAVASGATWLYGGGAVMWSVSAVAMTTLALFAVGPSINIIRWLGATCGDGKVVTRNKIMRGFQEFQHSSLLNAKLARHLVMLSAARFAVVVLMAEQTAEAIGAHIPLWHMAAAVPFVVMTTIIAVTPGGIGVNELTYATVLHHFGTTLAVAAQWSMANRVLATASCIAVTAFAISMRIVAQATALSPDKPNNGTAVERS